MTDEDDHKSILIENERDSLHILPMKILPLSTPNLKHARMIKNARLDSVIELFRNDQSGSGQLQINDLPNEFDWDKPNSNPDMQMIQKIGRMPSYDVFSLRIELRKLDISVDDYEDLKLSPEMGKKLTTYMTGFTRPLVSQIYGKDDVEIETFDDVIKLFRDPDVKKALERLNLMADKLGIKVEELPRFLEDYGDIFMSLSYYRRCMDLVSPIVSDFLFAIPDLRKNFTLKGDVSLQRTLDMLEKKVFMLDQQIKERFESFDLETQDMWDNLSAEKFRNLQQIIKSYHTTLGGVLCSLNVKMDAWNRLFPHRNAGGPQRRAEFIMTEMRQGMDKIKKLDTKTSTNDSQALESS